MATSGFVKANHVRVAEQDQLLIRLGMAFVGNLGDPGYLMTDNETFHLRAMELS